MSLGILHRLKIIVIYWITKTSFFRDYSSKPSSAVSGKFSRTIAAQRAHNSGYAGSLPTSSLTMRQRAQVSPLAVVTLTATPSLYWSASAGASSADGHEEQKPLAIIECFH